LRARDFMDKVTVDVDEAGAIILLIYDMTFPDLVKKGFGCRGHPSKAIGARACRHATVGSSE